MYDMFAYCHKAIAINLPNFKKTKINNMQGIFFQDFELKYINLSNNEKYIKCYNTCKSYDEEGNENNNRR